MTKIGAGVRRVGVWGWAVASGGAGVFFAVALGVGVLAVAAASGPLFLSSTGSAALARIAASECPETPLPTVSYPQRGVLHGSLNVLQDRAGLRRTDAAVRSAFTDRGLPAPFHVLVAQPLLDPRAGRALARITLFSRAGALDHVTVLRRRPGRGLWFSDLGAARLGLSLGDTVAVGGQRARIVGIYRDLNGPGFGRGVPRYWCSWANLILTRIDHRPPPLVLTDDGTLVRLAHAFAVRPGLALRDATAADWYSALDTGNLTLTRARDRVRRADGVPAALARHSAALAGAVSYQGDLGDDTVRAVGERRGVRGSVIPIGAAGTLVAVLLVAATGGYWAERRRREVALLVTRGVGPAAIAVKAVLETLPAALSGAAAGWAGARLLVTRLGPSRLLEPGAAERAAIAVSVALGFGLVALGALAAGRSRSADRRAERARPAGTSRWWHRMPWEVAPLGAALICYLAIRDGSAMHTTRGGIVMVSPLLVLFPLLALTGGLAVAARLTAALLPLLRRAGDRLPPAPYLATRRLTGAVRVTLGLVALVSVPVGLLMYAGTVTRSASTTVEAKADVYSGADAVLVMNVPPASTPRLAGHGTVVSVFQSGQTAAGLTEVLGVDPATFPRFAFADRSVLGAAPAGLVRRLTGPGSTATSSRDVPAVLVGCGRCPPVTRVRLRTSTLPVRVVARVPIFPGMRLLDAPMLVVNRRAVAGVDNFATRQEELWTTAGELPAASARLDRDDITVTYRKTPGRFLDVVDLVPLTWTFGYLAALAALIGLIAFAALLLYLGARQRATAAAHVLTVRMGLTRPGHLRSLAQEIGGVLGYGWLIGVVLGVGASVLVGPLLDFDPAFPPPALLRIPPDLLVGTVVGALAATVVGVLTAHRTAARQSAAAVLTLDT